MEKLTLDEFLKIDKKLFEGKIFALPTDTVFGVACLYQDPIGLEKIYKMKKRDLQKKIPILCSNIDMVKSICCLDNQEEYYKYWPGAITLIVPGLDSNAVAVRIPNNKTTLSVIDYLGPLYVTSVNYSGEKELNDYKQISQIFDKDLDYIICENSTKTNISSTVVDCTEKKIKIIRQGSIII